MFSKEEKLSRVENFPTRIEIYRLMQENLSKWRGSKIDKDLNESDSHLYNQVLL